MNAGLIVLIVAGVLGRLPDFPPIISICLVAGWCGIQLVRSMGRDLPILEITSCVYCLQLLVCPWVAYQGQTASPRYQMVVSADEYFQFVIPAVCAFLVPICVVRNALPRLGQVMNLQLDERIFSVGVWFCLIGVALSFVFDGAPTSIRFLLFLVSEIRFVGALYCYFSRHRHRRSMLIIVGLLMITSSMAMAEFHQILIWGAILMSLVIARELRNPSVFFRATLLASCFITVVMLESYKAQYREARRMQTEPSVLNALLDVAISDGRTETQILDVLRVRLNQGWIVSNVLSFIPRVQPFLGGESFESAFKDALIPRALFEKQTKAGGRDTFRKMTGLQISDSTSMGVSPIGEAYADFGPDTAILAMFCFGVFYAGVYYFSCRWAENRVLFYLWLPLIFSQAMKCETELAVVLNFLVKAIVFSITAYAMSNWVFSRRERNASTHRHLTTSRNSSADQPRMVRSR